MMPLDARSHDNWIKISRWIVSQIEKHGAIVYEGEKAYDWVQALLRECYGPDWENSNGLKMLDNTQSWEPLPIEIVEKMNEWHINHKPEWVTSYERG
jgi:hypothetical protein